MVTDEPYDANDKASPEQHGRGAADVAEASVWATAHLFEFYNLQGGLDGCVELLKPSGQVEYGATAAGILGNAQDGYAESAHCLFSMCTPGIRERWYLGATVAGVTGGSCWTRAPTTSMLSLRFYGPPRPPPCSRLAPRFEWLTGGRCAAGVFWTRTCTSRVALSALVS